eukprot:TRINITY_DN752_c0_g1_i3.p2 TRINITY_DN752_c0_g1~~TRINITY_DN752_c0_g1_i3.p2  ORF type:complete len:352 (-),score=75.17 TRINITY_DN752_c0_g1_i3:1501-2556(-)
METEGKREIFPPGRTLQLFMDFYFVVDSELLVPEVTKHFVEGLYCKKVPLQEQYGEGKVNVRQNVRNGVTAFIFDRLSRDDKAATRLDEFGGAGAVSGAKRRGRPAGDKKEASSEKPATKKRRTKPAVALKQELDVKLEPLSQRARFESGVQASPSYPFLRVRDPGSLDAVHTWAKSHADYGYAADDARTWESEVRQKVASDSRRPVPSVAVSPVGSPVLTAKRAVEALDVIKTEVRYDDDQVAVITTVPPHRAKGFENQIHETYMELSFELTAPSDLVTTAGDGVPGVALGTLKCDVPSAFSGGKITHRVTFPVGILVERDECRLDKVGGFYVFMCKRKKETGGEVRMVV